MINQYNITGWYLKSFRYHHHVCLSRKWGVGSTKTAERAKVDGVLGGFSRRLENVTFL